MSERPTHVIVQAPINCIICEGKGVVPHGFDVCAVCPRCKGERVRQYAMPLEEFAKLFTYGQSYQHHPQHGLAEAPINEIRVKPT
jgi:hypothetical protein